jgi:hypothetical protein
MSLADAGSSSARPRQQADIRLVHGGAFGVGSDNHPSEEASVHRLIASRTAVATDRLRAMLPPHPGRLPGEVYSAWKHDRRWFCCDGCVVVAITAFARCNAIKR